MKLLYLIIALIFTSCNKAEFKTISLNPNINNSPTKYNNKIWDVFDRKINILIIDKREENFLKNRNKYQFTRFIKDDSVFIDRLVGYKQYNDDEATNLLLDQKIMPVIRTELIKGLKNRGFQIVVDDYDRILTVILEDFSYIAKEGFIVGSSEVYLKLKVKSGLYDKLYEIEFDKKNFLGTSIEEDQEIINKILREAIISILNNKKLILMLQG